MFRFIVNKDFFNRLPNIVHIEKNIHLIIMNMIIIDMNIELESIGTLHTQFKEIEGMPIQPTGAKGIEGTIEIKEKYVDGLKDLDGFSHIHLIYLGV